MKKNWIHLAIIVIASILMVLICKHLNQNVSLEIVIDNLFAMAFSHRRREVISLPPKWMWHSLGAAIGLHFLICAKKILWDDPIRGVVYFCCYSAAFVVLTIILIKLLI